MELERRYEQIPSSLKHMCRSNRPERGVIHHWVRIASLTMWDLEECRKNIANAGKGSKDIVLVFYCRSKSYQKFCGLQ